MAGVSEAAPDESPADFRLTGFACLWAAASLFHVASYGNWRDEIAVALAAVWLLGRPGSLPRLLTLAATQIFTVACYLPWVSNHWILAGFVNLALVAAFAREAHRASSLDVHPRALYETFAPLARWLVVVLYFYAVLHKLNGDFLSPEHSCGALFYREQLGRLPFLPDGPWLEWATIVGTLAVEAAIPVLLIVRRTRHGGVAIAALFHVAISLNPVSPFYNFSSHLLALYALFLAPAVWRRAEATVATLRDRTRDALRGASPREIRTVLWLAPLLFLALVRLATWIVEGGVEIEWPLWIWLGYAAALFALLGLALRGGFLFLPGEPGSLRLPARGLALVPLLLFVHGCTPYLGLKTDNSFAMYSNLRTEGGRSNHLFMPSWLQAFDYQRDLVTPIQSSDPRLLDYAQRSVKLTWFEFRDYLSRRPSIAVAYERGGETFVVPRVETHPELSRPVPTLLRKLLRFRAVPPGPSVCRH